MDSDIGWRIKTTVGLELPSFTFFEGNSPPKPIWTFFTGLPSWPGLIEELAKFVESAGAKDDLVRAEAVRGDLLQASG